MAYVRDIDGVNVEICTPVEDERPVANKALPTEATPDQDHDLVGAITVFDSRLLH